MTARPKTPKSPDEIRAEQTAAIVKFVRELYKEFPHLHNIRDDIAEEIEEKFQ